ncbi:MAG: hypothetical protein FRX48_07683 [Lasallia pustulata]|uniref:DUF1308 domain-containing protein n=1 Tax=Lasallia pustulata TaxID=136370 RepID=A0A5M8PGU5_9LECA|nr:MAG: hypothetical protein FRX48_07683 [Lasallia pustulata]
MSDAAGGEQQPSSADNTVLVGDLLQRCRDLLDELGEFKTFLVEQKKDNAVELRQFYNSVASELKSLEKLSNADPTADRTIHTLRSSNLPFYTAVWTAAKSCTGLVTFNKRFYWDAQPARDAKRGAKPKRRSALVDIVAQDGAEWVKVSTVTETRLLFELAKAGWECGDSTDDSEEDDEKRDRSHGSRAAEGNSQDSSAAKIELHARPLPPPANPLRPRQTPHPSHPSLTSILFAIRSTGATIQTAHDLPSPSPNPLLPTFARLLPHPFTHFTPTLNLDCTILLALVSDLSHQPPRPAPCFHKAIARQLELEARDPLLPGRLYPALGARHLVCTAEAARRMREIVAGIGTGAEKERTRVVMGDGVGGGEAALRSELGRWSRYEVPGGLRLPVREVGAGVGEGRGLSKVQRKVAGRLTVINRSVFLYGWIEGFTTVSSNRTVAKLIESIVEEEMEGEEERGPDVWLCGTARSLLGKEKGAGEGSNVIGGGFRYDEDENDDDGTDGREQ